MRRDSWLRDNRGELGAFPGLLGVSAAPRAARWSDEARMRVNRGERTDRGCTRQRPWLVAVLVLTAGTTARLGFLAVRLATNHARAAALLAGELRELEGMPWAVLVDARLIAPERWTVYPADDIEGSLEYAAFRGIRGDPLDRNVEVAVAVEWVDVFGEPCRLAETRRFGRAEHRVALLVSLGDGKTRRR